MTSPLKIGIDIDGVLIDTDDIAYLNYCEKELGWNINYAEFKKSHSWSIATGQNSLAMSDAFREFLSSNKQSQKLIPGAVDAISKLATIAEIFLITSRRDILRDFTEHFIKQHLNGINDITLSMDNYENKSPRLDEFNLNYFIDDSHTEISKILENDKLKTQIIPFPTFHVQPDWSKIKINEHVIWLNTWQDITIDIDQSCKENIQQKAWEEISQRVCL